MHVLNCLNFWPFHVDIVEFKSLFSFYQLVILEHFCAWTGFRLPILLALWLCWGGVKRKVVSLPLKSTKQTFLKNLNLKFFFWFALRIIYLAGFVFKKLLPLFMCQRKNECVSGVNDFFMCVSKAKDELFRQSLLSSLRRMAGYLWSRSDTRKGWGTRVYPFTTPTCCVA